MNSITLDGWGVTGYEHESHGLPCQDHYGMTHNHQGSLICVSDGCSSAQQSELGSLVLTRSTLAIFQEGVDFFLLPANELLFLILNRALNNAKELGFDLKATHATLLCAVVNHQTGATRILTWGDGFVGVVHAADSTDSLAELDIMAIESHNNMPYYPAYQLTLSDEKRWQEMGGGQQFTPLISPSSFQEGPSYELNIRLKSGDLLFLSTDGAAQVHSKSALDVFSELGLIKSWAGRFLGRRMNRAKLNWSQSMEGERPRLFLDDFSLAALYFKSDSHPFERST